MRDYYGGRHGIDDATVEKTTPDGEFLWQIYRTITEQFVSPRPLAKPYSRILLIITTLVQITFILILVILVNILIHIDSIESLQHVVSLAAGPRLFVNN